jgi:hypothetical protein
MKKRYVYREREDRSPLMGSVTEGSWFDTLQW